MLSKLVRIRNLDIFTFESRSSAPIGAVVVGPHICTRAIKAVTLGNSLFRPSRKIIELL
jgi:hypothetical protein